MAARKKTNSRVSRSNASRNRGRSRPNKRLQSQGFVFPARMASVLTVLTVLCLSYLWLCSSCESLGGKIKVAEFSLEEVSKKVMTEEYKWSDLIAPANMEKALRKHNLAMTWPRPDQVVHIRDMALWKASGGHLNDYTQLEERRRMGTRP